MLRQLGVCKYIRGTRNHGSCVCFTDKRANETSGVRELYTVRANSLFLLGMRQHNQICQSGSLARIKTIETWLPSLPQVTPLSSIWSTPVHKHGTQLDGGFHQSHCNRSSTQWLYPAGTIPDANHRYCMYHQSTRHTKGDQEEVENPRRKKGLISPIRQ